jgi:transposase
MEVHEMKEQLLKQVYTNEFRDQAVLLVTRDGLSIAEAARRLSMSLKTLANWVKRARDGRLPATSSDAGVGQRVVTEAQAELSRLKRENAELRMERDILKKATAYFATESLRGVR